MIYRAFLALALLFSVGWSIQPVAAQAIQPAQTVPIAQPAAGAIYTSPVAGAQNVNLETGIAVRLSTKLSAAALSAAKFTVSGSKSGNHAGSVMLSDDGITLVYKPNSVFALGETVHVVIQANGAAPVTFDFHTRTLPRVAAAPDVVRYPDGMPTGSSSTQPATGATGAAPQNFSAVTLPYAIPVGQVTTPASGASDGLLFTSNFTWLGVDNTTYLMIIDNNGQPVYYHKVAGGLAADFKKQPNGLLTYYDSSHGMFYALNNAYQVVDTFAMGNGYSTDVHDLQILANGHSLMMSYDNQPMDLTSLGGRADAVVQGLIIQELDAYKNVVFEWRSWDHMNITDTYMPLTTAIVDYVHGNALELDYDGNIMFSSRHIHEITKINRQTGAYVWRMGGKNNQFNFTDDPGMFHWQHDIRRLVNGNITLFDNNSLVMPGASRALEYAVDEQALTVTKVKEYINPIPVLSFAMGNNQRLPNGNSLIGWGSGVGVGNGNMEPFPNITEVKPDGSKAFEMMFPAQSVSYRAFRFPWHGHPTWAPTLVLQNKGMDVNLYYSWNGATEISSYKVYASKRNQAFPNDLIAVQPKTGFENSTVWTNGSDPYCYFRIMPVDNLGHETQASAVVLNPICFQTLFNYLPYITNQDLPAVGRR